MSHLYPIMLDLEGRTCVIVGGGKVAVRKVSSLLDTGAQIIVISPDLDWALAKLRDAHKISVQQIAYTVGILSSLKPFLVFAATEDEIVNQQVVEEARALGALVNAASEQGERDFINMATVQRGDITIVLSSGGGSPALISHLHHQIDEIIGEEYATLSAWMAKARPIVLEGVNSQPERAALWRRVIESSILDTLRQGNESTARAAFDRMIQEALNHSS